MSVDLRTPAGAALADLVLGIDAGLSPVDPAAPVDLVEVDAEDWSELAALAAAIKEAAKPHPCAEAEHLHPAGEPCHLRPAGGPWAPDETLNAILAAMNGGGR